MSLERRLASWITEEQRLAINKTRPGWKARDLKLSRHQKKVLRQIHFTGEGDRRSIPVLERKGLLKSNRFDAYELTELGLEQI